MDIDEVLYGAVQETWKPIPGYWDKFEASDLGRIRIRPTDPSKAAGKVLSVSLNNQGYFKVWLVPNNEKSLPKHMRRKLCSVARLVALAFIGVPDRRLVIDHINEDRTDNRPSNLRWVTTYLNSSKVHNKTLDHDQRMPRAEIACAELRTEIKKLNTSGRRYTKLINLHGDVFSEELLKQDQENNLKRTRPYIPKKTDITVCVWEKGQLVRKSTLLD